MQYRVQSSVTEERLVRPTPQEPPKSYTPLNALSCMLPPSNEIGECSYNLPAIIISLILCSPKTTKRAQHKLSALNKFSYLICVLC